MLSEETLRAYRDPAVVEHYDGLSLRPSERHLFDAHLKKGGGVLDLGVGAGRTTPALSTLAGRYVGLDFSDKMIARCREKYPKETFVVGDAADLSAWDDATFDGVVFSFNGLGCLPSDELRTRCLREIARVLKPGGTFIFSLHNPDYLVFRPVLGDVPIRKFPTRIAYALYATAKIARSRLGSPARREGHGFVNDGTGTGGPDVYTASPDHVRRELGAVGLRVIEQIGADWPNETASLATPWFYYASTKTP
jgi:SAM-dependent methyltransferase